MDYRDTKVQQRIHFLRAKAELLAILEYYPSDNDELLELLEKIETFLRWMEEESPLS